MKSQIEKLISEYDQKIELCDREINILQEQLVFALLVVPDKRPWLSDHRKEIAIEMAVRQSLVKARFDFDSLFGYV